MHICLIAIKVKSGAIWQTIPMIKGPDGDSAYQVALNNGFEGTEAEWLESLSHGPKGDDGAPGTSYQFIFKRTDTAQAPEQPVSPTDTIPDTWSAVPLGVTVDAKYEWVSVRIKNNNVWTEFSIPGLWAIYGFGDSLPEIYIQNVEGLQEALDALESGINDKISKDLLPEEGTLKLPGADAFGVTLPKFLPKATPTSLGAIKLGTTLIMNEDGVTNVKLKLRELDENLTADPADGAVIVWDKVLQKYKNTNLSITGLFHPLYGKDNLSFRADILRSKTLIIPKTPATPDANEVALHTVENGYSITDPEAPGVQQLSDLSDILFSTQHEGDSLFKVGDNYVNLPAMNKSEIYQLFGGMANSYHPLGGSYLLDFKAKDLKSVNLFIPTTPYVPIPEGVTMRAQENGYSLFIPDTFVTEFSQLEDILALTWGDGQGLLYRNGLFSNEPIYNKEEVDTLLDNLNLSDYYDKTYIEAHFHPKYGLTEFGPLDLTADRLKSNVLLIPKTRLLPNADEVAIAAIENGYSIMDPSTIQTIESIWDIPGTSKTGISEANKEVFLFNGEFWTNKQLVPTDILGLPELFEETAPAAHNHDDLYYTKLQAGEAFHPKYGLFNHNFKANRLEAKTFIIPNATPLMDTYSAGEVALHAQENGYSIMDPSGSGAGQLTDLSDVDVFEPTLHQTLIYSETLGVFVNDILTFDMIPGSLAPTRVALSAAYRFVTDEQITSWNSREFTSNRNIAGGYLGLNLSRKIDFEFLPDIILGQVKYGGTFNINGIITSPFTDLNGIDINTLTASAYTGYFFIAQADTTVVSIEVQTGDWIISNGVAGWAKVDNTDAVTSVNGRIGAIVLSKSDVGLSNVDNTADANKNVLSATKLFTPRTIWGQSFDGTEDVFGAISNATTVTTTSSNGYYINGKLMVSDYSWGGNNNNVWLGGATNSTVTGSISSPYEGNRNIAIGTNALKVATIGNTNVAIGYDVMSNLTTGFGNIGIGYGVLKYATGGTNNVALGPGSLGLISNGSRNIAIGSAAGPVMTTGQDNILMGSNAGFKMTSATNNIGMGAYSLYNDTYGGANIALGYSALYGITTTNYNIGIGREAGRFIESGAENTLGDSSIYIGYNTRPKANNNVNQIIIGHQAIGFGSNTVTIGNTSIIATILRGALSGNTTGLFTGDLTTQARLKSSTLLIPKILPNVANDEVAIHAIENGYSIFDPETGTVASLDDLTDVTLVPRVDKQVLYYNGGLGEFTNGMLDFSFIQGYLTGERITQSADYRFVTDAQKLIWNAKQDALDFVTVTEGKYLRDDNTFQTIETLTTEERSHLTSAYNHSTTFGNPHLTKVNELSDTVISGATTGEVLMYNASTAKWYNAKVDIADVTDLASELSFKQPLNSNLTTIAGLNSDGLLRRSGGVWGIDNNSYALVSSLSNYSLTSHTHSYAGSSAVGGAATSANAVNVVSGNEINLGGNFIGDTLFFNWNDGGNIGLYAFYNGGTSLANISAFQFYENGTTLSSKYAAYSHAHDDRYYTETEIGNYFSGSVGISGYNKSNWDTAYSWGHHAGLYLPLSGGNLSGTMAVKIREGVTERYSGAELWGDGYSGGINLRKGSATYSNAAIVSFFSSWAATTPDFSIIDTTPTRLIFATSLVAEAISLQLNGAVAFFSTVSSTGFIKSGSSDSYLLLGGGGHKAVSDFAVAAGVESYETNVLADTYTKGLSAKLTPYVGITNTPSTWNVNNRSNILSIGHPSYPASIIIESQRMAFSYSGVWTEVWTKSNLTNTLSNGYLPYWNGSSLVNSTITSSGGDTRVGHFLDGFKNSLTISNQYQYEPELAFGLGDISNSFYWLGGKIVVSDNGNYNGKIEFKTCTVGREAPTTKMTILANGNIGIGYTDSSEKLAVNGDGYFNGKVLAQSEIALLNGGGLGSNGAGATNYPVSAYEAYGWNFTVQEIVNGQFGIWNASRTAKYFSIVNGGNAAFSGDVNVGTPSAPKTFSVRNIMGYGGTFLGINPWGGNVSVGWDADQGYKLAVNGETYFNGSTRIALPAFTSQDATNQMVTFGTGEGYGIRFGYNVTEHKGYINVLKPGISWGELHIQGGGFVNIGSSLQVNYPTYQGYRFAVNGDTFLNGISTVRGYLNVGNNTNGTAVIDAHSGYAYYGVNEYGKGLKIANAGDAYFSHSIFGANQIEIYDQARIGFNGSSGLYIGTTYRHLWPRTGGSLSLGTSGVDRIYITGDGFSKMSNTGYFNDVSGAYHEILGNSGVTAVISSEITSGNANVLYLRYGNINPDDNSKFLDCYSPNGSKFLLYASGRVWAANYIESASYLKGTSIKIGANWEAIPNGNDLDFSYGGMKARLSSTGGFSAAAFYHTSDMTLKDIVKPLDSTLNSLRKMNTFYYTLKDDVYKKVQLGMSAQQFEEYFPTLVGRDSNNKLQLEYPRISVIAIRAIQELDKVQQKQEERIKQLEGRVKDLEFKLYGTNN